MTLSAIRVIELGTHIAAPAAAHLLAEWGADVIKVERPQGDPLRWARPGAPGGYSPIFESCNAGKRSVVLDLATPSGLASLRDLVLAADVFLTNTRDSALCQMGLDWERLSAIAPRLVMAQVSGFGLEGPDADLPAYDASAYWTRSGLAYMTAPDSADPFPIRPGVGDHACALGVASGVLLALIERMQTGRGSQVDASLLRTALFIGSTDVANQLRLGQVARTAPREAPLNPANNYFRSRDGRWFYAGVREAHRSWPSLCEAAGRPELVQPRYAMDADRKAQTRELTAELDAGFAQLDLAEIERRCRANDLVFAPLQDMAQVVEDPQVREGGLLTEGIDANGRSFERRAAPVHLPALPARTLRVPALGEHTQDVLSESMGDIRPWQGSAAE